MFTNGGRAGSERERTGAPHLLSATQGRRACLELLRGAGADVRRGSRVPGAG